MTTEKKICVFRSYTPFHHTPNIYLYMTICETIHGLSKRNSYKLFCRPKIYTYI